MDEKNIIKHEERTKKELGIKKTGRPTKFNETRTRRELLFECAELGLGLDATCGITGLDQRTINRYLKRFYGVSFAQFRKQKMGITANMLIKRAMQHAINAEDKELKPAILIFLLKNFANMTDKPEGDVDSNTTITLNYNLNKKPEEYIDVTEIQDRSERD